MSTKQQRKTRARKAKQAEQRERVTLERLALATYGGPRDAAHASRMSTATLRAIAATGRRRQVVLSTGAEATLAMAMIAGLDRRRSR